MSVIISLFIFVYLAAIVLASILSVVWLVSLFVSIKEKGFYGACVPASNGRLMRLLSL